MVILLILSRSNIIHSLLIIKVPSHSLLDALFKLKTWFPAEFLLEFGAVDSVTCIVA